MNTVKKIYLFLFGYEFYLILLLGIAAFLPLAKIVISIGAIAVSAHWLFAPKLKERVASFFSNKIALITTLTFFLYAVGLIYSSDLNYGLRDLRIKLPLLCFPVVLSSHHKIKKNHFKWILILFVAGTLFSTIYDYLAYLDLVPAKKVIKNVRDISQFLSHIRLSLMIVLCLFIIPFLVKKDPFLKTLGLITFIWLAFFLSIIESGTGLIIGVTTLFFVSIYLLFDRNKLYALIPLGILFIFVGAVAYNLSSTYKKIKYPPQEKNAQTSLGNSYDSKAPFVFYDNGNFSDQYFCEKELIKGWNEISNVPYNPSVANILIRYMTSKGYKKDYEGVKKLSSEDIKNIEEGIPNYLQAENNLMNRLYVLMFEVDGYFSGAAVEGNSLSQRIVYWKVGKEIGQKKLWLGHGTGDVKKAFQNHYKENQVISKRYQLRSHNQYISTFIAIGIIGVFLFLITLIIPLQYSVKRRNYFHLVFLSIALLSFLSEDTLENQIGVFFFSFFNALFLFQTPKTFLAKKYVQ